jgi:hypothetical protein
MAAEITYLRLKTMLIGNMNCYFSHKHARNYIYIANPIFSDSWKSMELWLIMSVYNLATKIQDGGRKPEVVYILQT